jgi:hypothetical protein
LISHPFQLFVAPSFLSPHPNNRMLCFLQWQQKLTIIYMQKVKLSLGIINSHAMIMYGGVDV